MSCPHHEGKAVAWERGAALLSVPVCKRTDMHEDGLCQHPLATSTDCFSHRVHRKQCKPLLIAISERSASAHKAGYCQAPFVGVPVVFQSYKAL